MKLSGDGILETKELEKWNNKHYTKFFNLFERINKVEIEKIKSKVIIYILELIKKNVRKRILWMILYMKKVLNYMDLRSF